VGGVNTAGRTRLVGAAVPPATTGSSGDSVGLLSVLGPAMDPWLLLVVAVSNVAGLIKTNIKSDEQNKNLQKKEQNASINCAPSVRLVTAQTLLRRLLIVHQRKYIY